MDPRLLMLTRFWLRVGGIALLFWCPYQNREDLEVFWIATIYGNLRLWANTVSNWWSFPLSHPMTYTKIWWIVCFAGAIYLIWWNTGAARLVWRGIWMGAGKCAKCGYDRAGLAAGKACPECGTT